MFGFLKYIVIVFLFVVLCSPFVGMFLSEKMRNHCYGELVYEVIANKETEGLFDKKDKAVKLFKFVQEKIKPIGEPYNGKPVDYLLSGRGWCDYQARTLNSLLGRLGILSRYAMLVDSQGISPHTINEIYLENKWTMFDSLNNLIFQINDKYLDAQDLIKNENLVSDVIKKSEFSDNQKKSLEELFIETLPYEKNWRRSTPRLKQYHIVDFLIGFYTKIFRIKFVNFYQDLYLKLQLKYELPEARDGLIKKHYRLLYR